jgi:hypothetical protein
MDANPYEDYEFTLEEKFEAIEYEIRFHENLLESPFDFSAAERDQLFRKIAVLEAIHESLGFEKVLEFLAQEEDADDLMEESRCVIS